MIWTNKRGDGWRKWFALLPVSVGGETVWLQWYWRRFWGDHYQVSFTDPRAVRPLPEPRTYRGDGDGNGWMA